MGHHTNTPHSYNDHHVKECYLPDELANRRYYEPSGQGEEAAISQRLARWRKKTEENVAELEETKSKKVGKS